MSSFLAATSANETNADAKRKQDAANAKLNNVAAFIETKILKEDPKVSKEIQMADAQITRGALMTMNQTPKAGPIDTSGFELD